MNRIIAYILLSFISLNLFAQSAEGRYVSRMTQDGTLIFISPKKIGVCHEIKNFEYDITCLSWADSVTVNFTFRSKSVDRPKKLKINSCDDSFICSKYSLLYTDIVKGGYEIRVTSKFPIQDIEKIFQCQTPPIFIFEQDGITRSATYSNRAWNKDRKKLIDIYNLYKLSR